MDTLPIGTTIDSLGKSIMGGFADERESNTEGRSTTRLSTVERRIVKDSIHCKQCTENNDPRKVPVHPHCQCNVITDSVESGVADTDSRFFNPQSLIDMGIEVLGGELGAGQGILLDPATTAILEAENVRFADLARWLETMQPYLDAGAQYVSIVVDDDTQDAIEQVGETISTIAEDSGDVTEAIQNRKLWFSLAKAVAL